MKNESQEEREHQALDALAAAALRQGEEQGVSQEEIDKFLKNPVPVSASGKRALEALGPDVIARVADASPNSAEILTDFLGSTHEQRAEFAAMHRKNQTGENEVETEQELERKRQEILRKLREKKDSEE